jgi:hypothetical protein
MTTRTKRPPVDDSPPIPANAPPRQARIAYFTPWGPVRFDGKGFVITVAFILASFALFFALIRGLMSVLQLEGIPREKLEQASSQRDQFYETVAAQDADFSLAMSIVRIENGTVDMFWLSSRGYAEIIFHRDHLRAFSAKCHPETNYAYVAITVQDEDPNPKHYRAVITCGIELVKFVADYIMHPDVYPDPSLLEDDFACKPDPPIPPPDEKWKYCDFMYSERFPWRVSQ